MPTQKFTLDHFSAAIERLQLTEDEKKEYEQLFPLYDSIIEGITEPKTFRQLYLLHCLKIQDLPEHYELYADVDRGMEIVKGSLDQYKMALDESRPCIALPMDMVEQMYEFNKEFYDDITEDGIPLFMSSPPFDPLRIDLINHLEGSPEEINWKIGRIAKVLRIGWESFVEGYQ